MLRFLKVIGSHHVILNLCLLGLILKLNPVLLKEVITRIMLTNRIRVNWCLWSLVLIRYYLDDWELIPRVFLNKWRYENLGSGCRGWNPIWTNIYDPRVRIAFIHYMRRCISQTFLSIRSLSLAMWWVYRFLLNLRGGWVSICWLLS